MKLPYTEHIFVGLGWCLIEHDDPSEVLESCLISVAHDENTARNEICQEIIAIGQDPDAYSITVRKV